MTLQLCVSPCAHASGDPPSQEPIDFPDDEGHWEEFDPAPLESWILDDFDWEIQESFPQRGDYWDDSLDGEWNLFRGAITHDPPRRASSTSLRPRGSDRWE